MAEQEGWASDSHLLAGVLDGLGLDGSVFEDPRDYFPPEKIWG